MVNQQGFTLLEILLVLVLLSLSAVAVISTLPQNQQDIVKTESQRLFQRLQLFNEEAMLAGKDFGIRVDKDKAKYVFLELKPEGWQLASLGEIPDATELPDGIDLKLDLSQGAWASSESLFEPSSLFDDEMFVDPDKPKPEEPPQIFILSSGEITPGEFVFSPQDRSQVDQSWYVQIQENGLIRVLDDRDKNDQNN